MNSNCLIMEKYEVKCALMQGTGIKGKKGEVIELDPKSKRVQDLVKRGWLEKVEAEKSETKEAPKKTTKKK